jgi:molybdopterin/thiamine biosynthesis adenylyltransferase/rhodanese-related sulfurtransferase
MKLSEDEIAYYSRQILLHDFSIEKQLLLKQASVFVIGAGGLGCTVLQMLASAGVGIIGVLDYDVIEVSNLNRQILYTQHDVGQTKAEVASKRLRAINPYIEINSFAEKLNAENIKSIIQEYDIVVDATDNFDTKYLINDACVLYQKTLVFAAVQQYEGQVAVFNYHNSCNYRDIFPEIPNHDNNCNTVGVLNTAVNIIGTLQATEVLKIILKAENILQNKILIYHVLNNNFRIINISKQYDFIFKDLNHHIKKIPNSITIEELSNLPKDDYILIDVRTAFEHKQENKGGINIPLENLEEELQKMNANKMLVFYCNTNVRSQKAIKIANKYFAKILFQ